MNTKKLANYEPAIVLEKDTFVHEGTRYHVEERTAKRGELILTTKTVGHYKKGQVYEVSDYDRQKVWAKKDEGFIPVYHGEYAVLVTMVEAQPLPTTVYSPSMMSHMKSNGIPTFSNGGYHHTVLDFSEVEGGHTVVAKLPAGDHITFAVMPMNDRVDAIVDIQYHGENGQQMIGFSPNGTPRVTEDRIKHNLYSLDIRPAHKDKPYGSVKDTSFRRLDEVIIDISMNVGILGENSNIMPDGYDSRSLIREIHNWAIEFEKEFGNEARDDYYERVDAFSKRKLTQWAKEYTE